MKKNKKEMVARTLDVGIKRVILDENRLDEINEAITRQDIKDLLKQGAIKIKEKKGRRKNVKRKTKKREGKKRKRKNNRKKEYIVMTRKLRRYLKKSLNNKEISREEYYDLRKKIRARKFDDLRQLKRYIQENIKEK